MEVADSEHPDREHLRDLTPATLPGRQPGRVRQGPQHPADDHGRRTAASLLINKMYSRRGYETGFLEAAEQPNRITLVASDDEHDTLGTLSLDKAPARKFVQEFRVGFPSVYDPSGRQLLGFRGQISPSSIPSTLVIDKQGKVAARVIGPVTTQTLIGMVKDAGG